MDSPTNSEPSLKDVLNVLLGRFDRLSEELKDNTTHVSTLERRTETVEAKQADLGYELELIKQKQLVANLCITGVKSQENQNLYEIFSKICKCLKVDCNENEVNSIYRTKGQYNTSIIVQLKSEKVKHKILAAKKIKQSIIVDELEINSLTGSTEININGHLTPYFAHILFVARQAIKRGELQAGWFTNKGILIRANNQEAPILIKSVDHLAPYVTITNPSKRKATDIIDNSNHPPKKVNPINQPTQPRAQKPPRGANNKVNKEKAQPALRNTRSNSTVTPPPTFASGSNG